MKDLEYRRLEKEFAKNLLDSKSERVCIRDLILSQKNGKNSSLMVFLSIS